MEDDFSFDPFDKLRLVTDDRDGPLFKRSLAAARKRRQVSVHREWNAYTEWWVGHVFADGDVYRVGVFASLDQAYAATISYYYEIQGMVEREDEDEDRAAEEPELAAAGGNRAIDGSPR
jgi:hypothetical protein